MDTITQAFVNAAQSGKAIYITDVRAAFLTLDKSQSFSAPIVLTRVDGKTQTLHLRLPKFSTYPKTEKHFAIDFFLAEMYNILSSLGGTRARLANPDSAPEAELLAHAFHKEFGVDLPRSERTGYGKCLNVLDRMTRAIHPNIPENEQRFVFEVGGDIPDAPPVPEPPTAGVVEIFKNAASGLNGKTILGVDIGGTDIKLALAHNGKLAELKEYDWFPASFTTISQMVDPIVLLVKLMSLAAAALTDSPEAAKIATHIEPAMRPGAGLDTMERIVAEAESKFGKQEPPFDAIGMCFPDVVVNNKIVGGEVFKTRGIRDALGRDYDREFAKLTDLDVILQPLVKKDGRIGIVNDGPMAAFTAGVEMVRADPEAVTKGVFAYTLGTELGTGWVTENGVIPNIPLEVYNFIVDMGSIPARAFEPDDLRSINNFNTRLPGTLQKFACQSGVFRMALENLSATRPEIIQAMRDKGFVVERPCGAGAGLYVPTEPRDMRKPFLEFMMELAETDADPEIARIFEVIGESLAVTGEEIDWILAPSVRRRTLFGRLVKRAACFDLMLKGAKRRDPNIQLAVADDGIAETPLMKELSRSEKFTVAQFAQAVGAVHYGNYILGK